MKRVAWLLSGLLLWGAAIISGRPAEAANPGQEIVIPFELRDYLIIVPCRINDSPEAYDFVVDTGGLSMIDKALADTLQLKQLGPQAKANALQIGAYAAGKMFFFTQFDFQQFKAAYGMTVRGLIGSDFLEDYVVTIDYNRRQLTLSSDPDALAKQKRENPAGLVLPFRKHPINHAPMVSCRLNGDIETAAMVDTGQPYPLVLPLDMLEKTGALKEKGTRPAKGEIVRWPGTTKPDNYLARLKSFTAEKLEVAGLLTVFAELPAVLSVPLLGQDFLAQFLIVIDYPRGELFLRSRSAQPGPGRLYSTGLQVRQNAGQQLAVAGVWEKSPADRAGIHVGDRVLSFNGQNATPESHQALWRLLNDDQVKSLDLLIETAKGPKKFRLKKEDL